MADRRRPRETALRAQTAFAAAASSDDDDMQGRPTRSSRRAGQRLDISKLDIASLHRYRKFYKLGDAPATATKEDLIPSIARHFGQQVVDEEETLLKFVLAVQKENKLLQQQQLQRALLRNEQLRVQQDLHMQRLMASGNMGLPGAPGVPPHLVQQFLAQQNQQLHRHMVQQQQQQQQPRTTTQIVHQVQQGRVVKQQFGK